MTEADTAAVPAGIQHRRTEFHRQIADKFVQELKAFQATGHVNLWQAPWVSSASPHNGISGHKYSGVNAFTLRLTADIRGIRDPRWYSFLQISDQEHYHPKAKWKLRSGSHGTAVQWYHGWDVVDQRVLSTRADIDAAKLSGHDIHWVPWYTTVFSAEDIEGVPPYEPHGCSDASPDATVSAMADAIHVPVKYDQFDAAYYTPTFDQIHVPKLEFFRDSNTASATILHELCHSTGHSSRLNRPGVMSRNEDHAYAKEELTAELAACLVSSDIAPDGLPADQFSNSASYLSSWISDISTDPNVLMTAFNDADDAANYLLRSIKKGDQPNDTSNLS